MRKKSLASKCYPRVFEGQIKLYHLHKKWWIYTTLSLEAWSLDEKHQHPWKLVKMQDAGPFPVLQESGLDQDPQETCTPIQSSKHISLRNGTCHSETYKLASHSNVQMPERCTVFCIHRPRKRALESVIYWKQGEDGTLGKATAWPILGECSSGIWADRQTCGKDQVVIVQTRVWLEVRERLRRR